MSGRDVGDREAIAEKADPLGIEGIAWVEYATAKPQAPGREPPPEPS